MQYRSQNQEIMEFGGFIPHIIKSRFHYTKIDENNSPELLELLFKHISHKNSFTNDKKSINCVFPFPPIGASNWRIVICYLGGCAPCRQSLGMLPWSPQVVMFVAVGTIGTQAAMGS